MNASSAFQSQYPLSKKKFRKKMIEKIFIFGILSIFFALGIGAVIFFSMQISSSGFLGYLACALFGYFISMGIFYSLYGWYVKAYIRRYYYDCSDDFVTIQKGVFTPTEIHVQYGKIQDVYVDQDFLDRFMGLYDVHIASATYSSGIAAHIDGVDQPIAESLKNLLLNKIKGGSSTGATVLAAVNGVPVPPRPPVLPKTVNLSQPISSDQFPISNKWIFLKSFAYLFYSAIFAGILINLVFNSEKDSDTSLARLIGFAPSGVDIFLFWLLLFVVVFSFRILWLVLWKKSYRFEFLPEYIMLKDGVISKEERHLPYHTIQNVIVSQGFWEKFFGMSSVTIQNAATSGSATSRSFSLNGIGRSGNPISSNGIQIPGQDMNRAKIISDNLNGIISATADNRSGL